MSKGDITLQGAFETRGEFWLPEREDDRIPGRLSYNAGRIELELFGSFGQPPMEDDLPETELILGFTEAGRCTLAGCIRIDAKSKLLTDVDLAHSTWSAIRLFLGANFKQDAEIVFSRISFGFDALEAWLGDAPFDWSVEEDTEGHPVTTVVHRFPESVTIELPELDASLELDYGFNRSTDFSRSISWEHVAGLKVVPTEAQHFDWFAERLDDLRSLFSLLVGEGVTPTRVSGRLPDDERTEITVLFPYTGEAPKRSVHPARMLLSRDRLGGLFSSVVQSWFEKRELLRTTVALLSGTLYTKDLPGEFRFLALTQALETFHRRTQGGLYVAPEEYAAVEERLVAAIAGGIPEGLRDALKARLRYGNELSLRRRLEDLMSSLDEESRLSLSADPDFIDGIVRERNYLTHYPEGETSTMDGEELYYASLRLRALLMLLLLKEIGVEGKEAVEGLHRTRWSPMLRR